MEKNNIVVFSIAFLILGAILGYMVSGNSNKNYEVGIGTHMMPDGRVMSNNGNGGMSGMMDDMMMGLNGKTGDAFDQAFLEEMIVHHEGAVLMAQSALKSAKHQEIKDMASGIISAQTTEINQMRGWLKSWYGK
jgi:uncharacterized protein (DUF305 family)